MALLVVKAGVCKDCAAQRAKLWCLEWSTLTDFGSKSITPAEPGALSREPLEAAVKALSVSLSVSHSEVAFSL